MTDLPTWLQLLLVVLRIGAIGVVCALLAAHLYRRGGAVVLVLAWAFASLAWGYASFRSFCNQPLTCDVVTLEGNPLAGYRGELMPGFTVIAAATLAAAIAVAMWSNRQQAGRPSRAFPSRLVGILLVGVVTFTVWLVARLLVLSPQGWPRLG